MADDEQTKAPPDLATIGLAVLALLVDEREARIAGDSDARPTEALLGKAGLSSPTIGELVGKTPGAVRMTVSRSKKPRAGRSATEQSAAKKPAERTSAASKQAA
jgi:hypothetical protein